MSTTWQIRMGDYPAGFDQARLLVATFQGMSMVAASDGFDTTYHVMLEAEDGTCPVDVRAHSFAEIAQHCAYVKTRKPIVVLQRYDTKQPFGFVGFIESHEVERFTARLRERKS